MRITRLTFYCAPPMSRRRAFTPPKLLGFVSIHIEYILFQATNWGNKLSDRCPKVVNVFVETTYSVWSRAMCRFDRPIWGDNIVGLAVMN